MDNFELGKPVLSMPQHSSLPPREGLQWKAHPCHRRVALQRKARSLGTRTCKKVHQKIGWQRYHHHGAQSHPSNQTYHPYDLIMIPLVTTKQGLNTDNDIPVDWIDYRFISLSQYLINDLILLSALPNHCSTTNHSLTEDNGYTDFAKRIFCQGHTRFAPDWLSHISQVYLSFWAIRPTGQNRPAVCWPSYLRENDPQWSVHIWTYCHVGYA